MRMILMLEDVSIWRLLFIMAFFALLILAVVRTAPSSLNKAHFVEVVEGSGYGENGRR